MTPRLPETLEKQIERLVREHLARQQAAATAAVERAFAVMAPARPSAARRGGYKRRGPVLMAQLAERLCEAVRACPGETMTVISARVGESPRLLNRPMLQLKRAGRVRSAGERNFTRYFPMPAAKSA